MRAFFCWGALQRAPIIITLSYPTHSQTTQHNKQTQQSTYTTKNTLKTKGIIYRDVKPDNFLFLTNLPDSPLKATDFGLAIRHAAHEPKLTSRSGEGFFCAFCFLPFCFFQKGSLLAGWCVVWACACKTVKLKSTQNTHKKKQKNSRHAGVHGP